MKTDGLNLMHLTDLQKIKKSGAVVIRHYIWQPSEIYSSYSAHFVMKIVHNTTIRLIVCAKLKVNVSVYSVVCEKQTE